MPHRNLRYRLDPGTLHPAILRGQCRGATRFVGNDFPALNPPVMAAPRLDPSQPRPAISFLSPGKAFTAWRRKTDGLPALSGAPIRPPLKDPANAWKSGFKSANGVVKFKSRHCPGGSVTFPEGAIRVNGTSMHGQQIGQGAFSGAIPLEWVETKIGYEPVEVNPKYPRRRYHRCGHADPDHRKTPSGFEGVSCGHWDPADIHAAWKIATPGTRATGRGRGVCAGNLDDPSRSEAARFYQGYVS